MVEVFNAGLLNVQMRWMRQIHTCVYIYIYIIEKIRKMVKVNLKTVEKYIFGNRRRTGKVKIGDGLFCCRNWHGSPQIYKMPGLPLGFRLKVKSTTTILSHSYTKTVHKLFINRTEEKRNKKIESLWTVLDYKPII